MVPITWPEFADLHPFAPDDDSAGLRAADRRAGGVAGRDHRLRRRQRAAQRRQPGRVRRAARHPRLPPVATATTQRTICLIPSSAHGTNAASAVMAGLDVVVVATDDGGNVDLDDLRAKLERGRRPAGRDHGDLPVDPRRVRGGDRRDLRRRARRRRSGVRRRRQPQRPRRRRPARAASAPTSATSTCTRRSASPTAAAGPASARSACARHLAPFLPGHPARRRRPAGRPGVGGAVRVGRHPADPVGVHRADGRRTGWRRATAVAICSANYVADPARTSTTRCSTPAPTGRVGHECIVDLRAITKATGRHRRRRRQAADGLRLPRPDDELPGRRHADDRADRERDAGRARPLLRRDDRDPRRDRPGRRRRRGRSSDSPLRLAPHTAEDLLGDVGPPVRPRARRLPAARRCGRRSTSRRCRASTPPAATATWSAPASRSRRTPRR